MFMKRKIEAHAAEALALHLLQQTLRAMTGSATRLVQWDIDTKNSGRVNGAAFKFKEFKISADFYIEGRFSNGNPVISQATFTLHLVNSAWGGAWEPSNHLVHGPANIISDQGSFMVVWQHYNAGEISSPIALFAPGD